MEPLITLDSDIVYVDNGVALFDFWGESVCNVVLSVEATAPLRIALATTPEDRCSTIRVCVGLNDHVDFNGRPFLGHGPKNCLSPSPHVLSRARCTTTRHERFVVEGLRSLRKSTSPANLLPLPLRCRESQGTCLTVGDYDAISATSHSLRRRKVRAPRQCTELMRRRAARKGAIFREAGRLA